MHLGAVRCLGGDLGQVLIRSQWFIFFDGCCGRLPAKRVIRLAGGSRDSAPSGVRIGGSVAAASWLLACIWWAAPCGLKVAFFLVGAVLQVTRCRTVAAKSRIIRAAGGLLLSRCGFLGDS